MHRVVYLLGAAPSESMGHPGLRHERQVARIGRGDRPVEHDVPLIQTRPAGNGLRRYVRRNVREPPALLGKEPSGGRRPEQAYLDALGESVSLVPDGDLEGVIADRDGMARCYSEVL